MRISYNKLWKLLIDKNMTNVAFRTKCKIFSRHLQKPILKKKKDVLKGCKIPSKTSFSYCFFFGFRFPCSSTIRSFPVILC